MKIIAEIIGYAAVLLVFFMFQQNVRKKLIFCKLLIDFLWIIHFALLGGYTIVYTTSIAVFRELVFINRDRPFFKSVAWLWLFIALYIITPVFTWEGIYSIFPVISSVVATVSLWVKSVKKTKAISLVVSSSQLVYEAALKSYSAMTYEIVTIISILISFLRKRNKNE